MGSTVLAWILLLAAANFALQLLAGGWLLVGASLSSLAAHKPELLSLDPERPNSADCGDQNFQGYPILGRMPITLPYLWFQLLALQLGLAAAPVLFSVVCFRPRHALQFGITRLLICFECCRAECYRGDSKLGSFTFLPFAAPLFNRILTAQGIPIAPHR